MIIKTAEDALSYVKDCAEEIDGIAQDIDDGGLHKYTASDILSQLEWTLKQLLSNTKKAQESYQQYLSSDEYRQECMKEREELAKTLREAIREIYGQEFYDKYMRTA